MNRHKTQKIRDSCNIACLVSYDSSYTLLKNINSMLIFYIHGYEDLFIVKMSILLQIIS